MPNPPPRTPSTIARYEREKAERRRLQREAMELRNAGYSMRRIAEIQGCAITTAISRCKRAIARDVPEELIIETRKIELDRLDSITVMNMALLMKSYQSGDVDSFCKVQDRVHAVHDRRKKLVPIEVPTRIQLDQTVEHLTDQDRELSALLNRAAEDVEEKIRWLSENAQ